MSAGRRDRPPAVFNTSVTWPAIIRSLEDSASGWAETADRDIKCRSFRPSNGDIRYYTAPADN